MVLTISIDPSDPYGSDSSLSDDDEEDVASGVQVSLPPVSPDHDEWANRPYPEVTRPRDLASRPKMSYAPLSRRNTSRRKMRPQSPDFYYEREEISLEKAKPQTPDWQLRSGNQDKDITVHLDLDSALDISQDLGRLSRLNRLGHFKEAESLFKERLASHLDFFPVVAEYADILLEQGRFGTLERFVLGRLDDSLVHYSMDEMRLLKLLKSLAMIYSRGALIPALEVTIDTLMVYGRIPSVGAEGGEKAWSDLSPGFQVGTRGEIKLCILAHCGSAPTGGNLFAYYRICSGPFEFLTNFLFPFSSGVAFPAISGGPTQRPAAHDTDVPTD